MSTINIEVTKNVYDVDLQQNVTSYDVTLEKGYYPLPGGSGNVDTSNLVPYTGANKDVNIASNYFKTSKGFDFTKDGANFFSVSYRYYNDLKFISNDNSEDNFGRIFLVINPEEGFLIEKITDNGTENAFQIHNNETYSRKPFVSDVGFKTPTGTATQALRADGGVFDLTTKADLVGGKVPKAQSQPSTMVMDNSTYVITFTDATGAVQTIDLPLESLFKDANYDAQTKSLIVTLDNGTTKSIPLTDLVDLPEIVLSNTNPSVNPTTGQKVYFNTSLGKVWFNVSGAWVFAGNLISDSEKTNLSNAYTHSQATGNPHNTTKADIGLGNVDNTSDLNKPISTATQNALNTKANIVDIPSKTSFTHDILVSNWAFVLGKYEAVISNAGILSNSFVDVIPINDHVDIVRNAQIYPSVLISVGSVKVYSKFLPSGTISVTVNVD